MKCRHRRPRALEISAAAAIGNRLYTGKDGEREIGAKMRCEDGEKHASANNGSRNHEGRHFENLP